MCKIDLSFSYFNCCESTQKLKNPFVCMCLSLITFQELQNIITYTNLRKTSCTKYPVAEQTYLVSRSLIPVPLLLCIAFHAVLFKRTSYLEGGRVICEAKMRKNNHIVIECGKHISSPRCE